MEPKNVLTNFIENPTFDNALPTICQLIRKIEGLEQNLKEIQEQKKPPDFINIKFASKLLHLSVSRLYTLCQKRKVPCIKRGQKYLFSRQELIDFMNQGKRKTEKEIIQSPINPKTQHELNGNTR